MKTGKGYPSIVASATISMGITPIRGCFVELSTAVTTSESRDHFLILRRALADSFPFLARAAGDAAIPLPTAR